MKVISASPSKLSVNGFDLVSSDEQNLLQFRLIPMIHISKADFFISEFRERKLFKTINRHIKEQKGTASITGILYGAGHAKAILAHLEQWGYSIQKAFPLTVFNIK